VNSAEILPNICFVETRKNELWSRGSAVGIVTVLRVGRSAFLISAGVKYFSFSKMSRPAPIQ